MTEKGILPIDLTNQTIESMIYEIRGQKIMFDFDLAKIYGYDTRRINEQVKNNIDKFDLDFRFQLSKTEWDEILMSKKSTSSWGGSRKLPYAFSEQGIYMLMTVIKGASATKQSIALIDALESMVYEIRWRHAQLRPCEGLQVYDQGA